MSARFERIVVGALGIVHNPQGEVLFVRQRNGPFAGSVLLPGGGIEFGENARCAVVREVLEETGVEIHDPRCVAWYEMRGTWAHGRYHLLMAGFRAESTASIPPDFAGHNVDGVMWLDPHRQPIHATDMRILTDAGLARFSSDSIADALRAAGIEMDRLP